MNKLLKQIFKYFIAMTLLAQGALWAAEMRCDVCGMSIPEHAKNHIVLETPVKGGKMMHVCSVSCLKKGMKHNPDMKKTEFANFNKPDQFLDGDRAFFLKGSDKIKSDIGEMAMPPYLGAYETKKDADAARAKYGEGSVVQGVENALK